MERVIPDQWPLFLTKEQLCAYLGGMDERTLSKILPVQPLDLGANILRWNRQQVDAWAASLPPRLPKAMKASNDAGLARAEPAPQEPEDEDLGLTAAEIALRRAQKRAAGGRGKCRKRAG
ncbi:hypothetical protein [Asticcacaulis sp.]|uniref:hypothetical protein n=1 Tax=Asticcacaulis sp. TaxID=1872648 RepID=UPI00262C4BA1|nr:hypothetical protein [Asticcacaulis sp.]